MPLHTKCQFQKLKYISTLFSWCAHSGIREITVRVYLVCKWTFLFALYLNLWLQQDLFVYCFCTVFPVPSEIELSDRLNGVMWHSVSVWRAFDRLIRLHGVRRAGAGNNCDLINVQACQLFHLSAVPSDFLFVLKYLLRKLINLI